MFDKSYIKRSGQLWKLGLFFASPLVSLSLIAGALTAFATHKQVAVIAAFFVGKITARTAMCKPENHKSRLNGLGDKKFTAGIVVT